MELDIDKVLTVLKGVVDPQTGEAIAGEVWSKGLRLEDGVIRLAIEVSAETGLAAEPLRYRAEKELEKAFPQQKVQVVLTATSQSAPEPQSFQKPLQKPRPAPPGPMELPFHHCIAVASGKGGVGKSTVAVNLALALAAQGQRVGLLDADIYGPSVPHMLGLEEQARLTENKKIKPFQVQGLTVMSMGFMTEKDAPVIWRGPMVISAIRQMLGDVAWTEDGEKLDVLVIDMPPGTGDAQLTISQRVPLSGAVIVSTPQDIALIDARKGLKMFQRVEVPILGLVENMSYYQCPSCGHEDPVFGHGGAVAEAETQGVDCLARIPLNAELRLNSDEGVPLVVSDPDHTISQLYGDIARQVLLKLSDTSRTATAQAS